MTGQANFLQSLGWAVFNSFWQLALLWILYQLINGVFRKLKSSHKTSLASFLLVGGFVWFVYTLISSYYYNTDDVVLFAVFVNTTGNQRINEWLQQGLPIVSVFYLVLLLAPLFGFVRNYRYVQIIRRYGITKINVEWRMFVSKVAAQMEIKKKIQIWISEFVSSPVTIGFLKPIILVPLAAINNLTPRQLEAVLLHEISHIKRSDYLVNLVINIIQTVLYFNPFVKAFVEIVEKERENSCDEMVLQFQYDSHEYARALLELEKANHSIKSLAIAASGKKNYLLHRIELILGVQKKSETFYNKLAGLMAGVICVIAINSLLLFSNTLSGKSATLLTSVQSHYNPYTKGIINEYRGIMNKDNLVSAELSSEIPDAKEKHNIIVVTAPSPARYIEKGINMEADLDDAAPYLLQADYETTEVPNLKKYQETQINDAMEASKKIVENMQWKFLEKNMADAFSQQEKEEIKASYEKGIAKIDWKKWETSLKQAFDKIDWDNINNRLSNAVAQIRMDSVQMVYNKVIQKLDILHKELSQSHLKAIPDSDITLKELEKKKVEMQKSLTELKAVRSKKIVHL